MDEIRNSFSSPAWWFSAVFLAIVVNVLSAYLKSPIDKLLSKISTTWRNRNEAARAQYLQKVNEVQNDHELQTAMLLEALSLRSKSNGWLLTVVISGLFLSAALQVRIAEIVTSTATTKAVENPFNISNLYLFFIMVGIAGAMKCAYAASDRETLVSQARRKARGGTI